MRHLLLRAVVLATLLGVPPGPAQAAPKTWQDLERCLGVLIPVSDPSSLVPKTEFRSGGRSYSVPADFHPRMQDAQRRLSASTEIEEMWLRAFEATFLTTKELNRRHRTQPVPTQAWVEHLMRESGLFRLFREVLESRKAIPRASGLLEALRNGNEIEELAINTHQGENRQEATATYLKQGVLANVPTVSLVSPNNRLSSRSLFERSDLLVLSPAGELDPYWVNARIVHLFGGSCGLCLSGTVESVVKGFVKNSLKDRMTVYFHGNYIYSNQSTLSQIVSEAGPSFAIESVLDLHQLQDLQLQIGPGRIVTTPFGPGLKFLMTSRVMKIFVSLVIVGVKDAPGS